jgi:hypothetical protein
MIAIFRRFEEFETQIILLTVEMITRKGRFENNWSNRIDEDFVSALDSIRLIGRMTTK